MRLTTEQQQEIRALYAAGGVTQQELAERFEVHQWTISRIVRLPPRACVGCGVPLVGKTRCEVCSKPHNTEKQRQWYEKHKEQYIQAARLRQETDKSYREQHNRAAREYERRQRAKKRGEHIA